MRVLITGICGFVGSHLADYILENHPGVEVFGLKRWRSPRENIKHIIEDRLKLCDGDLRDLSSTLAIIREVSPDWIFHLAAQSYVPMSYSAPNDTLMTNVIGTANLLEACRIEGSLKARIHICSSPEVYGDVNGKYIPIKEDCPLNPVSPYGVSKVAEDALGSMYHSAYGLDTVRSRAFSHEGPRRGEVFAVSSFARQIAAIEKYPYRYVPVVKVGNLKSVRTFCDVRDIVRAYWLLLEYGELGEVYNIGGNDTMTMGEVMQRLLSMSPIGGSIEVRRDSKLMRPKDVTLQIPDCSKFKHLVIWEPQIPFEQTLKDTLDYWRERV